MYMRALDLIKIPIAVFTLILLSNISHAQFRVSIETGVVSTLYNDVRVPNGETSGKLFSLEDDFDRKGPTPFFRAELAYLLNNKHTFELTAAPLTVEYENGTRDSIYFAGRSFGGPEVDGRYEFNTYRASYRYRLVDREKWSLDAGASVLLRDARIALFQGDLEADDTDLGVVPLISFELQVHPSEQISLMLKGDALVGPVGRAEDIFAGILYTVREDQIMIKAGYRVIEGGADVDQVYNFAFINFADVGLVYKIGS